MGDPLYDERRRLEKENEILRLRRENSRLKDEAEFKEQAGVISAGLAAFFSGKAHLHFAGGEIAFIWQKENDDG